MHDTKKRKFSDVMEIKQEEIIPDNKNMKHSLTFQDKKSICLLTFLYILQGIPLGLAGSIPYILQSRLVSYSSQATFSLVFWPFSLKIFWAPIADSFYLRSIGRRKSWLIPAQMLIGFTMIIISAYVTDWIENPNFIRIYPLTASFFFLNFLAATQDIAVDGWALTMLSKSSVGWASTCNSVGQTAGYFIAFIIFLSLESASFCNAWIRTVPQDVGIITFSGFLYFWGVVFIFTTTLVFIFKKETSENHNFADGDKESNNNGEVELGVLETYQTLWKIVKLKPILLYIVCVFFIKFGFSATDSITGLKLMEKGVSKEKMAFIGSSIVPMQILLAIVVSKYTTGTRPLDVFIYSSFPRLICGALFAVVVYMTPSYRLEDGSYPTSYYIMITIGYFLHQIFVYPMFVSVMAFHARISDPLIGGTYMTFLNTISNLCGNLPNTFMLYLVDQLSFKTCIGGARNGLPCNIKSEQDACLSGGESASGKCITTFDSYYAQVIVCTIIGFFTILLSKKYLFRLQELTLRSWRIR